jgi:hypothetical protein
VEQLVPQLRIGTPAQKGSLEPLISCATGKESTEMTAHLPLTPETAYLSLLRETAYHAVLSMIGNTVVSK